LYNLIVILYRKFRSPADGGTHNTQDTHTAAPNNTQSTHTAAPNNTQSWEVKLQVKRRASKGEEGQPDTCEWQLQLPWGKHSVSFENERISHRIGFIDEE
jgi:hypothetical protein